ncbi:T9SS type A sorting domain-containing protein [Hymenobacter perfusus]|uniref:T9SS C-terminal target domain-containing protein n=1 Tax=Hymenobacter perfusus TaxID=1236770 RepID=A0A428K3Y3_9BACT|nr:T9SS type A sorting domain-containing protein [Hymenobacter perfusus]RSK41153.1 T9SS C-terminal target domain-containing protein [Hymenobacter perfusus]
MLKKHTLLTAALLAGAAVAHAQAVNNVTEVVTSFGGFWQSSATAKNPVKPNNSHDLLAFSLNGVRYSTGVDDALLGTNNLTFTPAQFKALPVLALSGNVGGNTKVGLGELYDNVSNGASSPAPANDIPFYLRDGRNGLNLGTGAANVPSGTLDFSISEVVATSLGDGTPDILVTQIADPAGSQDQYQFLDANNQVIGNTVTVTFTSINPVGNWTADFYEASQRPMSLTAGFRNTDRDLRLWAADLSAFGITNGNVGSIRKFRVLLSGNSDLAFVAYNAQTATFSNPPLPVQLTSFGGQATATYSELTWNTAQEVNSEAFEVEASADGRTFRPVGRVVAAGNSTQARRYTYRHATTQAGPRYYRLRQVDRDGTSAYSSVVTLTAKRTAGTATVTAAPNPFHEKLELFVSSPGAVPASATVTLTTLAGRTVYTHDFSRRLSQSAVLELPGLSALPAGLYLARVVLDGKVTVLKVEKK